MFKILIEQFAIQHGVGGRGESLHHLITSKTGKEKSWKENQKGKRMEIEKNRQFGEKWKFS